MKDKLKAWRYPVKSLLYPFVTLDWYEGIVKQIVLEHNNTWELGGTIQVLLDFG